MAEVVYGLHDFTPEHDDEIAFVVGEPIEVVEKDDLYGDGWWQGRNKAGKVGLFPQAYTSPTAPVLETHSLTALQPLQEESAEDAAVSASTHPQDTVMAATLTDVQEAIEQLAVRRDQDTDAARSFSFASTRDPETETDDEAPDGNEGEGQGWHKDARKALAERAEKENERKKQQEEAEANGHSPRRQSQLSPPIAVELSDESDVGEDDEREHIVRDPDDIHPHHHRFSASTSTAKPHDISLNDPPASEPLQPAINLKDSQLDNRLSQSSLPTPTSLSYPQGVNVVESLSMTQVPDTATTLRFQQPVVSSSPAANVTAFLPSPANSSTGGAGHAANVPLPTSPPPAGVLAPVPFPVPQPQPKSESVVTSPPTAPKPVADSMQDSLKRTHPSEWTIEQVVEWLKTKGVDESTCNKFIEHEITGDVLLELDAHVLKEELNIVAFGKRMRITNAIVELRRPASFSSDPTVFHGSEGPGTAYANGNHQEVSTATENTPTRSPVGLGLAVLTPSSQKNRPADLVLSSPSDGALHVTEHGSQELIIKEDEEETLDDRGVQSENERPGHGSGQGFSLSIAKRRHFLGRSTESGSSRGDKDSMGRKSNEASPSAEDTPSTGSVVGSRPQHTRGKRSIDGTKGSERLSFFSTTLGKSRKPPPRYSMYETDTSVTQAPPDKSRGIAKLYLGVSGKKNGRPTTPTGGWKEDTEKDKNGKWGKGVNEMRESTTLRKRHVSTTAAITPVIPNGQPNTNVSQLSSTKAALEPGQSVLDQIGRPDHAGWLRKKGERYNTWKLRYLVLKGPHLYYLRSNSRSETKIKGYIKVHGYKVIADENANPGKYGFRIIHDTEQPHFFSSEEQMVVREWMKALMKATIDRDFSKPVVSSCNIPTIPLAVAQAMNPAPRPPSPTARAATQRALRRENPNQLSTRDARILMGLPAAENGVSQLSADRNRLDSFFIHDATEINEEEPAPISSAPPRPSREGRHANPRVSLDRAEPIFERELVEWANSFLPEEYHIYDLRKDLMSGLVLMRLVEAIRGKPSEPPVLDMVFTKENNLEGMFRLFDFLVDLGVKTGNVSINDIKQGRIDKTVQLLKLLRAWSEKQTTTGRSSIGMGAGHATGGAWQGAISNDW